MTSTRPRLPGRRINGRDFPTGTFVGGTGAMVAFAAVFADPIDFLVATEANMMWRFQARHPRHRYHPMSGITCACDDCPHMARNSLEKIRDGEPEVAWRPEFDRAGEVLGQPAGLTARLIHRLDPMGPGPARGRSPYPRAC